MLTILLWGALFLLGYIYVGYPAVAIVLARLSGLRVDKGDIRPSVTVIITAFNEAAHIEEKPKTDLGVPEPKPAAAAPATPAAGAASALELNGVEIEAARVDVFGRVHVYESIVKGSNLPEPGVPESFKFDIPQAQDLMPEFKLRQTDKGGFVQLEWNAIPTARAYFLGSMGGAEGDGAFAALQVAERGLADADVQLKLPIGKDDKLKVSGMQVEADLRISGGELIGFEPLKALSKFISVKQALLRI